VPEQNAPEVAMAGGAVSSSELPSLHLIPTEALVRLAQRFDLGVVRKKEKAWNAISLNQQVLADREFILHRIGHVIIHAMKLRDKLLGAAVDDGDDDAGAIAWAGAFLCCATKALKDQKDCSGYGGTGFIPTYSWSNMPSLRRERESPVAPNKTLDSAIDSR